MGVSNAVKKNNDHHSTSKGKHLTGATLAFQVYAIIIMVGHCSLQSKCWRKSRFLYLLNNEQQTESVPHWMYLDHRKPQGQHPQWYTSFSHIYSNKVTHNYHLLCELFPFKPPQRNTLVSLYCCNNYLDLNQVEKERVSVTVRLWVISWKELKEGWHLNTAISTVNRNLKKKPRRNAAY